MIKLEEIGNVVSVNTPYNAEFVAELKSTVSGRKWDGENKCWTVPSEARPVVERLLQKYFSWGPDSEMVTVLLKAEEEIYEYCGAVRFAGIAIAEASGRDSSASCGPGVTLMEGRIFAGGSLKNWKTIIEEGSVFRLQVPESALDNEDVMEGWSAEKASDSAASLADLEAAKTRLLAELATIESKIEALK